MLWLTALQNQRIKRKKNGLSIPYLVGVEREKGGRPEFTISNLIDEVSSLEHPSYIDLYNCGQAKTYILSSRHAYGVPSGKKFGSLLINSGDVDLVQYEEIEDLKLYLDALYSEHVDEKNYSTTNDKWGPFDLDVLEVLTSTE